MPAAAHGFGYLSSISTKGSGAGQVGSGAGVAVAADGTVYVADSSNNRIDVFTFDGTFVRAFGKGVNPAGGDVCTTATGCQAGTASSLAGALNGPPGVDIGPDGALYIADSGNYRISVFSPSGAFVRAFGKGVKVGGGDICTKETGCRPGTADGSAGSLGTPGGRPSPTGLDVDSTGTVYVADTNERIDVFTSEGAFVRAFGRGVNPSGGNTCTAASGCLVGPITLVSLAGGVANAWDVAVTDDGRVAVSDGTNRRVSIFEANGTFLRAFGAGVNPAAGNTTVSTCTAATECTMGAVSTAAGGFAYTLGIAVNGSGNLVAADYSNHRIAEFGFDGAFIRAFGEGVMNGQPEFQVCTTATGCRQGLMGSGQGSTVFPMGVAIDCTGAIYSSLSSSSSSPSLAKRFGESAAVHPPCLSPAPKPPPAAAGPASPEPSNEAPAATQRLRTSKPSLEIELNKGSGTATLVVIVSGQGRLILKGKGIRTVRKQAKRSGLYELLVAPTGETSRELQQTGKAKVKLLLTFKPEDGAASTQAKSVELQQLGRI